jgi:nucleoside-diphosphate-sugar epimerase
MRILVTGHQGYIGSVLIPVLRNAGHHLVGLDTCWFGDSCKFTEAEEVPCLNRDIRDVKPDDLEGFDAVVHLAGLCNDPLGELKPQWTYDINHRASVRLAQLARAAGVERFVFSSSCSVYGASGDAYLNEDFPPQPVTAYAESKVRVEEDVSKLANADFSPVFLRNATAYGVSPRLRLDLVLNNLAAWAFATGSVLIMSDGTPWRPLVHIQDISRAVLAVLEAPAEKVRGQIFNVGRNEENYQVRELANIVRDVVPGCSIKYAEGGGPDIRCYRVDFTKFERTFPDYPLQWNARKGVQELYEAFRSYGLGAPDLTSPRFIRLNRVEQLLKIGEMEDALRWKNQHRITPANQVVPSIANQTFSANAPARSSSVNL